MSADNQVPVANVLTQRFDARIKTGNLRWQQISVPDFTGNVDLLPKAEKTTNSIQIDLHPVAYKQLVDQLSYYYETGSRGDYNGSVHDKFVHMVYQKQFRESELREKHPLLQDLWDQYQVTLNLLDVE
jgi:hypothetical protein